MGAKIKKYLKQKNSLWIFYLAEKNQNIKLPLPILLNSSAISTD